jgi:hypothetical protein
MNDLNKHPTTIEYMKHTHIINESLLYPKYTSYLETLPASNHKSVIDNGIFRGHSFICNPITKDTHIKNITYTINLTYDNTVFSASFEQYISNEDNYIWFRIGSSNGDHLYYFGYRDGLRIEMVVDGVSKISTTINKGICKKPLVNHTIIWSNGNTLMNCAINWMNQQANISSIDNTTLWIVDSKLNCEANSYVVTSFTNNDLCYFIESCTEIIKEIDNIKLQLQPLDPIEKLELLVKGSDLIKMINEVIPWITVYDPSVLVEILNQLEKQKLEL